MSDNGVQLHVKNQKFGNVEKQSTIFNGNNFEAIIGLGYKSLAFKGVTPFFDEVINQKLLKSNIFAFYFTHQTTGKKPEMTLGYYDNTKYKGDINWMPVEFKYMYGVKLDDIIVGGKRLNVCEGEKYCLVTFDTGSSVSIMPDFVHKKLADNNLPAKGKAFDCEGPQQFGDMIFLIGGKEYIVPAEEWVY